MPTKMVCLTYERSDIKTVELFELKVSNSKNEYKVQITFNHNHHFCTHNHLLNSTILNSYSHKHHRILDLTPCTTTFDKLHLF